MGGGDVLTMRMIEEDEDDEDEDEDDDDEGVWG